jgi:hypothetical protein
VWKDTIERQEIRNLIDRSSDAINHQDWAALEALTANDVVWERMPPAPWTLDGRAAVHGFLASNSSKLDILHYAVSGSVIDMLDETHAVARSTMSELIRNRETGALRVVGTYSDHFVKSHGVWCFAKRTITPRYEHDTEAPTRICGKTRAYPQRDDVSV